MGRCLTSKRVTRSASAASCRAWMAVAWNLSRASRTELMTMTNMITRMKMTRNLSSASTPATSVATSLTSLGRDVRHCRSKAAQVARSHLEKGSLGTSRSVVLWNLLISLRATVPGLNLNLKPEIVALISTSSSSSPLARVRQGHHRKRKIIQQRFQDIKGDSRRPGT